MNYVLYEIQTELRKRLLDIDTMIKWNDFLDLVEERPRKVMVIYGLKLNSRTMISKKSLNLIFNLINAQLSFIKDSDLLYQRNELYQQLEKAHSEVLELID